MTEVTLWLESELRFGADITTQASKKYFRNGDEFLTWARQLWDSHQTTVSNQKERPE